MSQEEAYFKQSLDDLEQSLGARPKTWTAPQLAFAPHGGLTMLDLRALPFVHDERERERERDQYIIYIILRIMYYSRHVHVGGQINGGIDR